MRSVTFAGVTAAAAGTIDVQVKTAGGISPMNPADQYTYQQPVPTITAVSPDVGPNAGGSPEIAITGTDFTGVNPSTGVKFGTTLFGYPPPRPNAATESGPEAGETLAPEAHTREVARTMHGFYASTIERLKGHFETLLKAVAVELGCG